MRFGHIKPGDTVTRLLGIVPMDLRVTAVDDLFIHCGGWKFRRDTGGEVDEELGWDGVKTGSFLKQSPNKN